MQRSTEKLYKIFKLEAEFGYANKAVVGGLEKLTDSWVGEARADGLSEDDIQKVTAALNKYPSMDIQGRVQSLREIGHILDIPGIKYLESPNQTEQKSVHEEPPQAIEKAIDSQGHSQTQLRSSTRKRSNSPLPIPDEASPAGLKAPVTSVRGIGQKQSQLLAKLNLHTVEDMLYYFPPPL